MYRRIEVTESGDLLVCEREPEPIAGGSVRLSVSNCSINRGDIERVRGSYGGVDSAAVPYWRTDNGRFVPGYEPAGTVVEAGPEADPDLVGRPVVLHSHESCGACRYCNVGADNLCGKMRVFGVGTPGIGGWSEQVVVPADRVQVLSDPSFIPGACTYEVTYGTVLHNLRRGLDLALLPGPVVVRGAPGALAIAALQFCVAMDLPCVAIVRDPDSDRVRQLCDLLPQIAVVGEASGKKGILQAAGAPPAVVVEPLGGDYVMDDIELVARGGAVVLLGSHVDAISKIRADLLFLKGVYLYGAPRAPLPTMVEVASLVEGGFVTPVIDRVFELTDIAAALEYCEHPTGIGRVLLSMGASSS